MAGPTVHTDRKTHIYLLAIDASLAQLTSVRAYLRSRKIKETHALCGDADTLDDVRRMWNIKTEDETSWIENALWNGQPCSARIVNLVVGTCSPKWWCYQFIGQTRQAVRIDYQGHVIYIDNEAQGGVRKVTDGKGSVSFPHLQFPKTSVELPTPGKKEI